MADSKRKILLHFLAHLWLNLDLGSNKRLSHGLSQKVKSPTVFSQHNNIYKTKLFPCKLYFANKREQHRKTHMLSETFSDHTNNRIGNTSITNEQ